MNQPIETYGSSMRSLAEWVAELEADDRHPRVDIVVGTAIFWACSLDEALRDRHSNYTKLAAESPTGLVMLGLRFARDAVTHGFVLCAGQRGIEWPMRYPIDYGPNVWTQSDRILSRWEPRGKANNEGGAQLSAYRQHVERRPAGEPLRAALSWLEEWRSVSAV
ncbi:hypothetical protein [Agromyces sp. NPDC056965]|uniref:hypothetical protein n=1 Tax=Agromyces sp. NPDC056965 TaxID=3345983 RepID=UPI00363BB060